MEITHMSRFLISSALVALCAAPLVHAQSTASTPAIGTYSSAVTTVNDSLFAAAAAVGGMAEISIAELGVQRATDPELKRFSQQMIDEHTKMNEDLKTLAVQNGVALPRALDYRAEFCAESLGGLSGEKFDHCYAKAQLVLHMEAVAMFEAEVERGTKPQVKALAAKALPHIKQHLKEIKLIAKKFEKDEKVVTSQN
jgi:putative membrane protein